MTSQRFATTRSPFTGRLEPHRVVKVTPTPATRTNVAANRVE